MSGNEKIAIYKEEELDLPYKFHYKPYIIAMLILTVVYIQMNFDWNNIKRKFGYIKEQPFLEF